MPLNLPATSGIMKIKWQILWLELVPCDSVKGTDLTSTCILCSSMLVHFLPEKNVDIGAISGMRLSSVHSAFNAPWSNNLEYENCTKFKRHYLVPYGTQFPLFGQRKVAAVRPKICEIPNNPRTSIDSLQEFFHGRLIGNINASHSAKRQYVVVYAAHWGG